MLHVRVGCFLIFQGVRRREAGGTTYLVYCFPDDAVWVEWWTVARVNVFLRYVVDPVAFVTRLVSLCDGEAKVVEARSELRDSPLVPASIWLVVDGVVGVVVVFPDGGSSRIDIPMEGAAREVVRTDYRLLTRRFPDEGSVSAP